MTERKQHGASERQTARPTSHGIVDNLLERKQAVVARNDYKNHGGKEEEEKAKRPPPADTGHDKTAKRKKESTPPSPLDNFRVNLWKGCYEDPLPRDEMNPLARPEMPPNRKVADRPRKRMQLRGTNGCELTKKHYSWTGEHAT